MWLAALAACALAVGQGAAAADAATASTNRNAYEAAMKCFVVNGVSRGESMDAGERGNASRFEARARESFDVAVKLGKVLGYSGGRIDQDFGMAQARELPKLVKDTGYYKQAAAMCRALGLM